jgi:hypothetical protein
VLLDVVELGTDFDEFPFETSVFSLHRIHVPLEVLDVIAGGIKLGFSGQQCSGDVGDATQTHQYQGCDKPSGSFAKNEPVFVDFLDGFVNFAEELISRDRR